MQSTLSEEFSGVFKPRFQTHTMQTYHTRPPLECFADSHPMDSPFFKQNWRAFLLLPHAEKLDPPSVFMCNNNRFTKSCVRHCSWSWEWTSTQLQNRPVSMLRVVLSAFKLFKLVNNIELRNKHDTSRSHQACQVTHPSEQFIDVRVRHLDLKKLQNLTQIDECITDKLLVL